MANFVETEQLVEVATPQGRVVSAFVQVRGSIPLLWSQIPNIKYKPTTRLAPAPASQPAFDRHIADLVQGYKVRCLIRLQTSSRSLAERFCFVCAGPLLFGMAAMWLMRL